MLGVCESQTACIHTCHATSLAVAACLQTSQASDLPKPSHYWQNCACQSLQESLRNAPRVISKTKDPVRAAPRAEMHASVYTTYSLHARCGMEKSLYSALLFPNVEGAPLLAVCGAISRMFPKTRCTTICPLVYSSLETPLKDALPLMSQTASRGA